jgi:hypothetical protein
VPGQAAAKANGENIGDLVGGPVATGLLDGKSLHSCKVVEASRSERNASRLELKQAQVFDTRDSRGVMPSDHRPLMTTFEVR